MVDIPTDITSWKLKTVVIVLFLALMAGIGYIYRENTKLHDDLTKASVEAAECRAQVRYLEMRIK